MSVKVHPLPKMNMYFDGCSKGNPGLAGIGFVINENENGIENEICNYGNFIGLKTNNEAEYYALIEGLKEAINRNITELIVFGDSQLVIKQVKGEFKIKSDNLIPLHKRVIELKQQFKYINFVHVLRNKNKRADSLANLGVENYVNNNKFNTNLL